jgi:hypothetical protein
MLLLLLVSGRTCCCWCGDAPARHGINQQACSDDVLLLLSKIKRKLASLQQTGSAADTGTAAAECPTAGSSGST